MKLTTITLENKQLSQKYDKGVIEFEFENQKHTLEFKLNQSLIKDLETKVCKIDYYKNIQGTFFTNLYFGDDRYFIINDLLDEIKFHEPTPLKQIGSFDIYLTSIEYLPMRKKQHELKTFPGLKINYRFEDDFASPSFFYLSLHINDWKKESLKVYKEQKEILVLISLIINTKPKYKDVSIPKTLNAFMEDMLYDESKGMERIQELNEILIQNPIKTKIKSSLINDKHVVFFQGFFVSDVIKTKVDDERVVVIDEDDDLIGMNALLGDESESDS